MLKSFRSLTAIMSFALTGSSVWAANPVFAPIQPLSFVKPFAGANPLPQVFTVAAIGSNFDFTYTPSTDSGGNWLSVTATGFNCCTTPRAIQAVVNAPQALAIGTYTGHILIASFSFPAININLSVTLTVTALGGAYFDTLPGGTTFSLKTGNATLTSQTIQVRNGGSGSLAWTLSKSTSDGGDWITLSQTSGTAPASSTISVGVNVGNLPNGGAIAGNFTGQLLFQAATGNVTVPVTVVVGANILSQINGLNFTRVFGGADPLPQNITVASTGTNMNFDTNVYNAAGGSWLTTQAVGFNCCATPRAVTIIVTTSPSLAVGTYTGEVVFTVEGNGSMAIVVPVTLTIEPAGGTYFNTMSGQVSFSLLTGGTTITNQDIPVQNGGSGTLTWALAKSTSDTGNWLNISTTNGAETSGSPPSFVTVSIAVANLPNGGLVAGTFIGQLVFTQTSGGTLTIPVTVTVGASVMRQINGISFTKVFGGPNPLPQTLIVPSTGTNMNFDTNVYTATGGNWLSATAVGFNCCTTPRAVTASVINSVSLAVGTYTGQIVFTVEGNGFMSITVPVTLVVEPSSGTPFLDDLPGQLSFSMVPGGANPASQDLQIRPRGVSSLAWTLAASTSDGGPWLTVSATSGTSPSTVTVGIVKGSLPNQGQIAGTFNGNLVFRSGASSITVPISVVVGPNVFVQLPALTFTKYSGQGNPPSQDLNIQSTGTNFNFDNNWYTATGGNWLSVTVAGFNCCATPRAITANIINSASLAVGVYTGEIITTAESNGSMAMTIPVTLNVLPVLPQVARAVFRNPATSIAMTTYNSSTLSNSGGLFASDPSASEDQSGNLYVTARDQSNSAWANFYNAPTQTWSGWSFGGGIFQGVPAIAVAPNGTAWLAARDNFNSYWIASYSVGGGWSAWTPLFGIFSTDPQLTACSDGSVYMVGKDNYNSLYSGRYIPGTGFQGFQFGGGIVQGKVSITCGADNAVYIGARDFFNSHWVARVSGNTWTGWFYGGAISNSDPKVAALGGSIALVIRDTTNVIYRATFNEGTGNGWQAWTQVGGVLSDVAPAGINGELYFAGKAPNGDLWWYRQTGNQWTFIGNNGAAAGALASAPR